MAECPHCGKELSYGERDGFSLGMGETPYICPDHGNVGYRDHDSGMDMLDEKIEDVIKRAVKNGSKTRFQLKLANREACVPGILHHAKDEIEINGDSFVLSELRGIIRIAYHIDEPEGGFKKDFTANEKNKLRPIAETLAMLDGNAFFTMGTSEKEFYEQYLPEAHALYENNGGDDGWAGESSMGLVAKEAKDEGKAS